MPSHRNLLLLALATTTVSVDAFVASIATSPPLHRRVASSPVLFFDTLFPTKAPEVPWASSYKQKDIDALWNTLKQVYGSEAAARKAVKQNNQVICPLYATPATMRLAYNSLVKLCGKADAKEIMANNPAILQCGDLSGEDPVALRKAAAARVGMDSFARFLQGQ